MPVAVPKPDYFEVLDLKPDNAGIREIRIAYKKLALKWHPDRHATDKEEAQQRFIEISDAYKALLQEYQHKKRDSPPRAKRGRHSPPPASSPSASSSQSSSTNSDNGPASSGAQSKTRSESSKRHHERHEEHFSPSTSTPGSPSINPRDDTSSTHSKTNSHADPSSRCSSKDSRDRSQPRSERETHIQSPPSPSKQDSHSQPSSSHDKSTDTPSQATSSSRKRHARQSSKDSNSSQRKPESIHKKSRIDEDLLDYEFINLGAPIPPLQSRKSSSGFAEDWIFPLHLSLEDLYYGTIQHYRITRTLRSGETQSVKIDVHVSSGWHNGTQIRVAGVGNERKDGTFQDIVFVVEEEPHPHFTRAADDLIVSVHVPWADAHSRQHAYPPPLNFHEKGETEDEVYVKGLDGEEFALSIPRTLVEGADGTRIVGAGMPVRRGGRIVGKGDLIVRWDFVFPQAEHMQRSRWQTLKKAVYRRS